MVMVLEADMVDEIARLGRLRAPSEACGLLLPVPYRGQWVWELPNRSINPHDSFEMHGTDMALTLEHVDTMLGGGQIDTLLSDLVVWHTHPGGNLGPSWFDLQNRPKNLKNLVVTLFEDGTHKATFF